MSQQLTHIKTAEGLITCALTQIESIEPEKSQQHEAKEDVIKATKELQESIHVFKRLCGG